MKSKVLVLALLLWAAPVLAQTPAPHPEVVAQVTSQLLAAHANLSGDCGAFQITMRVAWVLRGEGAGLLVKQAGSGCTLDGVLYKSDAITYQTSAGLYTADILYDSGNTNRPQWIAAPDPNPTIRWAAPIDPGDSVVTPPLPSPVPVVTPPAVNLDPILQRLDALEQKVSVLEQQAGANEAILNSVIANFTDRLTKLEARPVPISCTAAINFGGSVKIPISCKLQ